MEYLNIDQIREEQKSIRSAFNSLIKIRALVCRPRSRQWLFFCSCANQLFDSNTQNEEEGGGGGGGGGGGEQDIPNKITAAQYKYEVENKLQRFYLRPGHSQTYVFTLVHRSQLEQYGLSAEIYPVFASYSLLVRSFDFSSAGQKLPSKKEVLDYLERVVADGIYAEFQVYRSLPNPDFSALDNFFVVDSPAIREIKNVVKGVKARGWHLQNELNPSTCRLLSAIVTQVNGREAEVAVKEYWYLRWWDQLQQKYTYPYRETNKQLYILQKKASKWLIFQNLRPMPRSSQPFKWNRRE